MKQGWLKILKPVTLEIAIFREKNQNFEWKTTLIDYTFKLSILLL